MVTNMSKKTISIWDGHIITQALIDSVKKLNPRKMLKNPVMFVVEVGAAFLTLKLLVNMVAPSAESNFAFELQITLWLWFTVLFANFAEAMAEGRGKAQADTLRKARTETTAKLIEGDGNHRIGKRDRPAKRRCRSCGSRRVYSRRRRDHRGRGVGGRIGYYGRIAPRSSANRAATARP